LDQTLMKQLQQFLKEKWFLVAADALVVIGVLSLGLDPKDGFQAFLAVIAILAAALIVLVPVLREDAGKKQRLAEQARLRAALAEEIDRVRDEVRSAAELTTRRLADAELSAKKAGEAASEAVARRASTEIAALRAELAALAKTSDSDEELAGKLQSIADTARAAAADAEEALENSEKAKTAAADSVRLGKEVAALHAALAQAQADAAKALSEAERANEEISRLRANPSKASAPAASIASSDVEPEAESRAVEDESTDEEEDEQASSAETSSNEIQDEPAPVVRTVIADEDGATGTRLLVNLMMGIGNKPFVRGTGPGLSESVGQPMQFVAIGRWLWVCPEGQTAATVQVWKNDKTAVGEPVHVPAGESRELDEDHFQG
jgi:chemotaxis protein histidine kinase CheA